MKQGPRKLFLLFLLLLWGTFSCAHEAAFIIDETISIVDELISVVDQKKSMKILMVVSTFPSIHEVCILNQITGLIDRGHEVHIYASRKGDCVNVQESVLSYDLLNLTFFKNLPFNLNYYDIIVFQLGHKTRDIKNTHNFKGKIAMCLRGYDITAFLRKNPNFYNKYFKTCDLFMPVCEAFKTILEQKGCSSDKIVVCHSAIDCSQFMFKLRNISEDETINIISAGRFVEKKGFEYSIKAIAQLIKRYPRIHYTIIGDGVLKETYQQLINQLGVADNIKIDSWRTHKEYVSILDKAHIFVLPSVIAENNDQEGIANVLKEAMAMGLIVVATDHSGNSELIQDGVSGFLVPERNDTAIAKAIEYIINNSYQWSLIQLAAAYKVHNEFEKEKENDKLEETFYTLLK
jgi:colanic acid/amylovoran biosynthesis glycosyltransferase